MLPLSSVGIIADDLTGACDVAACFANFGDVDVSIDGQVQSSDIFKNNAVINTQSRHFSPYQAKRALKAVGNIVKGKKVLFKKIDSALRGPVGAEIEGLSSVYRPDKIVVAPAIPDIGRYTRGAIQYDGNIPIDQTDFASDPEWPIDCADVAEIIRKTGSINFEVFDAQTNNDLQEVIDENLRLEKVLFVGSLGLAAAMAKRTSSEQHPKRKPKNARNPVIVSGSKYEKSYIQFNNAIKKLDAVVIKYSPGNRINSEFIEASLGQPMLISLDADCFNRKTIPSSKLLDYFVEFTVDILKRNIFDGIGIIGGQTAYELLQKLGITRLAVQSRIDNVLACGRILDGISKDCPIITKGGSVGDENAVIKMLQYLKEGKLY
jgi:D-threonate/D-erythronate kinase